MTNVSRIPVEREAIPGEAVQIIDAETRHQTLVTLRPHKNKGRYKVDWERMETDWRAGIKSVIQLAEEFGTTRQAVMQHWKKEGIERDLTAKINAKADAIVARSVDTVLVNQAAEREKQTIDANAQIIANAVLSQRSDVARSMDVVLKLWREVEAQGDHSDAFEKMGELMARPDEAGEDRLLDIYRASISLPQRIKSVKLLTDSLKALVELQRRILKIDDAPADNSVTINLTDSQRISRIALLIEKARA